VDHRSVQLPRVRALFGVHPEWRPVLWGDLSGMPAVDLLNILAQGRKSGLLLVRAPDGMEHALALQDGCVHWSDPGSQRDTVDAMVRLQQGAFSFVRATQLSLDGTGTPVHELLLDSLRRLDEQKRDDDAAA
jgi:hypothetical protein